MLGPELSSPSPRQVPESLPRSSLLTWRRVTEGGLLCWERDSGADNSTDGCSPQSPLLCCDSSKHWPQLATYWHPPQSGLYLGGCYCAVKGILEEEDKN